MAAWKMQPQNSEAKLQAQRTALFSAESFHVLSLPASNAV